METYCIYIEKKAAISSKSSSLGLLWWIFNFDNLILLIIMMLMRLDDDIQQILQRQITDRKITLLINPNSTYIWKMFKV